MKEQLETRLQDLRNEYQSGSEMMEDLQRRQDELRTTLLRISGAIQVLEEVLQTGETTPELG